MAFCAQCGAENKGDSRFCFNCGAPVGAAPVPPVPPVQQENAGSQQQAYQQPNYQQSNYQQSNYQQPVYQQPERTYVPDGDARTLGVGAVSLLAYCPLLFFIPLVAYKDSKFARFHAGQGLNLLLLTVACWIVTGIFSAIFMAISIGLGLAVSSLLGCLSYLITLGLMIFGIVFVCKGQMKPLPVIGNISIIKL